MITEIYKSTIGVVHITEIIFLALGFMPALIEAGFAGLIYEIVVFYVSSKIGEQAARINPTFGTIFMMLLQTFAPRPRFAPKVVDSTVRAPDQTGLSDVLHYSSRDTAYLDRAAGADQKGIEITTVKELDTAATTGAKNRQASHGGTTAESSLAKDTPARGMEAPATEAQATDGRLAPAEPAMKVERPRKGGLKKEPGKHESDEMRAEPVSRKTSQDKGKQGRSKHMRGDSEDIGKRASDTKKIRGTDNTGVKRPSPAAQHAAQHPYRQGLATPKQVADALRDTKIYEISGNARRSGGLANNADIADLGAAIGKHVEPGARGAVSVDPAISDALWTLPADLRGVLIERALGSSVYKDWFNVGALDHGFFPQVDFASRPSGALQADLVSVKSINPMTKAFHGSTPYTLSEHVTDIVTASHNAARATGTYRTVTVDIRIPPGNAVAGRELQKTLRWFVPPDLAKYVRVVVHEF